MIDQLSDRIWKHQKFHQELALLRETSLKNRYAENLTDFEAREDVLRRLLKAAAALSGSTRVHHRQAAYQIVTTASELYGEEFIGIPYAMLIVLSRIGNFPGLEFAKRRFGIVEDALPIQTVSEAEFRREKNTVEIHQQKLALTDFQYRLWGELNSGRAVGVSAPTSAGKSFILQAYAEKVLSERKADRVAFLVPTRALINQVSDDVSAWLSKEEVAAELITNPVPKNMVLPKRAVYVVTQERMQLLQAAHPDLIFDVLIVDEAQSLGDGPRGVLLSSVIEEALLRNSRTQILFAGPNLRDPSKLTRVFGLDQVNIKTEEATVSQNIIFANVDEVAPNNVKLSLLAEDARLNIGTISCDQPLLDHRSKLINLALRLGAGAQNLVYAAGPKECEDIAFGLADNDAEPDESLRELSDFIKEAVHDKYQLAQSVLYQVGYHYGRLPSLVRKAIEDAFASGQLRYLVTTSTLLYGVNLPAQNLFLHKPEKGQNQPIGSNDFWNLAGRAGRLGKEFSGNIFLVDYQEWSNDPIAGTKEVDVIPTLERHLVSQFDELLAYVQDPNVVPQRDKPDELENTFAKLTKDYTEGRLDHTLGRVGLAPDSAAALQITQAVKSAVDNSVIDRATLVAAPTVSIHRQQSLYERLERSLEKRGPQYIIPKHPLDARAYNSYVAAIRRCHIEVLKYPDKDRSERYYAQLALRWMNGDPLPRIIDASFNYKLSQGESPNIATVIRTTLTEIERELKFKYVRLFSCYNAVLELVLRNKSFDELVGSIPSIPMYLEVGACSPTMISFMGIGLSRYTAGKLRALPRRTDMNQAEARAWIRRQNIESLNLPNASIKEIRRLVVG